ncbi:hypothetical protein VKT23_012995 [Stygiomarasmius scandens]|uniref:Uncharacterized protein n=1 Tax=Marasmiellus scandens TaxID=2682957 RepID=A0ABR1J4U6_9AGAR
MLVLDPHFHSWLVLTFIVLICFDVMSTVLMSWGVFMIVRNQQGLTVNLKTLSKWRIPVVILKSGIMYYLIITGLQLGAVILYWLPQGVYSLVLNNYLTPLSTILVSRFLLDLREAMSQGSDQSSHTQEMQFAANSGADDSVTVRSFRIRSRGRMVTRKAGYQSGLYRDFQFEAGTQNQAGELD